MRSSKYDEKYFRKTRSDVGVLFPKIRPLWRRWIKIIRKYKHSGKLLDAGCGEGYFLEYAEKHYETYGIDASEYCIKEAKQRTNRTKLYVGGITHLDYDDEYFDVVTCLDVLEHLDNPGTVIQEFYRVLKVGGVFVIRVPNIHSIGAKWKKDKWFGYRDNTHVSLLSNKEWFEVVRESNFKILDTFYDGLWDTPYFRGAPKIVQDVFIKYPSLTLFWLGKKFSRRYGENSCVIAKKG